MRTFFIWFFGLAASGLVGGIIGDLSSSSSYNSNGLWGFLAGLCAFSCARLWLVPSNR